MVSLILTRRTVRREPPPPEPSLGTLGRPPARAAPVVCHASGVCLWALPFEVGWDMGSSLVAVWVTDYKLPRGVNDKLRDN